MTRRFTTARRAAAVTLTALALIAGACGGDDQSPSAEEIRAEAEEQAEAAADDAKEAAGEAADAAGDAAEKAADKADEVADDVADGPDKEGEPTIEIASPSDGATITGGSAATVLVEVRTGGITVVAADGDTSGKTGHFHLFVDREPTPVGQVIPKEAGIVHSATNPIEVTGLTPGEHTFTVVYGDGAHTRIHGAAVDKVKIKVE